MLLLGDASQLESQEGVDDEMPEGFEAELARM